ncbi:MAG: hypothetical protein FJ197_05040 [Gammaproteobacteria bacterium]|nr:hypothetical protein [Gammaproteobacteria bacterium]
MAEALVIRLDAAADGRASWVAVDASGALLGAPIHGNLSEAGQAAANRLIVALVPAADVLRLRAEVPLKGGSKLLQALPFALEDQIAEDVEALHFAAGDRDQDGRLAVAAVRRDRLAAWRSELDAAGVAPQKMYSEADAVQAMPNTATVLIEGATAVFTEPDGTLSTIDTGGLPGLLELWLARSAAAADASPLHLVAYGDAAQLAALGKTWEDIRPRLASLDLRALADGALPRLAAQIVTSPGVNLLQGEFARRSSLLAFWPAWRLAALLLAGWFVLGVAWDWAELRRVRGEIAALDRSIDQAFRYVFPEAGPITDARAQLSSQLQRLGDGEARGGSELLDFLRSLSQAMGGTSGIRLEALSYRAGSLELRLRAPSVEALERVQQQITRGGGGLQAQIQSANPSEEGVLGRLQISRGGQ